MVNLKERKFNALASAKSSIGITLDKIPDNLNVLPHPYDPEEVVDAKLISQRRRRRTTLRKYHPSRWLHRSATHRIVRLLNRMVRGIITVSLPTRIRLQSKFRHRPWRPKSEKTVVSRWYLAWQILNPELFHYKNMCSLGFPAFIQPWSEDATAIRTTEIVNAR